jgi:hypothetical protein
LNRQLTSNYQPTPMGGAATGFPFFPAPRL